MGAEHLRRAATNGEYTGVAHHALQRPSARIAGGAEYLQCIIGDFHGHFRGKYFGWRRFEHVGKASRGANCGAVDERARAVDADPGDIWAVHAVAHVHEMTDRSAEGIAWLAQTEDGWRDCNNFTTHVWWHRALYHFESEEYDGVLKLYDDEFRAEASEDYLDISNAVAMLWRLERCGVAIGGRWQELAEKAKKRTDEYLLVFADMHFALALAAAGKGQALDGMIESMRAAIASRLTTQEKVLARVGAILTQAIRADFQGDFDLALRLMLPLRYHVRAIGGSHAQRDIFTQLPIDLVLKCKKFALARALLHERTAAKPNSPRAWKLLAEALAGEGRAKDAAAAHQRAEKLLSA